MPTRLFILSIATGFLLGSAAGEDSGNSRAKAESPARVANFLLKKVP